MSIGIFHLKCLSKNRLSLSDKFFWAVVYPNLFFNIVVLPKLLIISGNIESNPGPALPPVNKNFSVCQMNARSILAESDNLNFLDGLPPPKLCEFKTFVRDQNFDIVAITETWLDNTIPDEVLKTSGYSTIFRRDRNRHGGGTALMVSDSLVVSRLHDIEPINDEIMCFDVTLPGSKPVKHLFLCLCYRPPDRDILEFLHSFELTIEAGQKGNFSAYVAIGDFNCRNSAFWVGDTSKHEGRMLKAVIDSYNLYQLVDFPTRFQDNSSSCLDLIITNRAMFIKNIIPYEPLHKCDHIPLSFEIAVQYPKIKPFKRMVWNFNQANWNKLIVDLQNFDWNSILNLENLDEVTQLWTEKFLELAKGSVPCLEVLIRPKDKPYMNKAIKLLIRKRNRAFHKFKGSRSQTDWEIYRNFRNLVVSEIRKSQHHYYKNISLKLQHEPTSSKAWWKYVKILSGEEVIQTNCPLWNDGILIYDQKEKADLMNDFFASITTLEDSDTFPTENIVPSPPIPELAISSDDVYKILSTLDISKATGPDLIGNKFLKICALPLSPILAKLFNRSLQEAHFPDYWKLAYITPIYKKGDRNSCTNYRPVSLLCCVSKVFERLVFNHIYPFLKERQLIVPNQSGFQPGDSTVNQLVNIVHQLYKASDQGEETLAVFLDLTKAFDKVWHNGLLHKLNKYGITGIWNSWFKSYLSNRKAQVVLNGQKSKLNAVRAGVPQGSVLGPLLFLLYINDITDNLESLAYMFADDTSLFKSGKDINILAGIISRDLVKIYNWSVYWKVGTNASKCAVMLFSRKQIPTRVPALTLGNEILHTVTQHKHLGLILSANLTWTAHINDISTTARRRLGALKTLKYRVGRKVLEHCYFAYIRSVLDYADIIYDNCSLNDSTVLHNIHMDAARLVTGAIRGTATDKLLYEELGWGTLAERREVHKLSFLYKIVNNKAPSYLRDLLPVMYDGNVRLQRRKTFPPFACKSTVFQKSLLPSVIAKWNSLPHDTRLSETLSAFKKGFSVKISSPPIYYNYQNFPDREISIMHTRLRLSCSLLRNDMYNMHISDTRQCPSCNSDREDVTHFFINCPAYAGNNRNQLQLVCHRLQVNFDVRTLLFGSRNLSDNNNKELFKAVCHFIKISKRFE